jgi:hypothetical protein
VKNFDKSLFDLRNASVRASAADAYSEAGKASVELVFSNGSNLQADYWRITKDAKAVISSFDHQQQYGLQAPLDAIKKL